MHPIITTLHFGETALPIASYGVMLAIAIWVGALGTLHAARRRGMELGAVISTLGLVIAGGFGGALLTHLVAQVARGGSLEALAFEAGASILGLGLGVSVLGALVFGTWTLVLVAPRLGLSAPLLLDVAVPWVALAQALGRVGCFLGGCCYGVESHGLLARHPVPLLYLARHPVPLLYLARHPVPLYEALALITLAAMFASPLATRSSFLRAGSGVRAASYLALYAIVRIALEPLRGDAVRGVYFGGAVSTAQILACVVLAGALWFVWLVRLARLPRRSSIVVALALGLGALLIGALAPKRVAAERFEVVSRSLGPIARIEAGTFVMGSDEADIAFAVALCKRYFPDDLLCNPERFSDEQPARLVELPAFSIDRTEVTNAAYRRCAQQAACPAPRMLETDARSGLDAQPVVMVTAAEAEAYCAFAGGRLPSEAEWERAARAGTARRFPWGNAWNDRLCNHARRGATSFAAPVGAFESGAGPYGLLDMAGNVWELTADHYDHDAYQHGRAPAGAPRGAPRLAIRPVGPEQGELRVIRGGSYAAPPHQMRSAQRASMPETQSRPDVGFRCAYAAPAK